MSDGTPLLREAINEKTVKELSKRIKSYWEDFNKRKFDKTVVSQLGERGLYERLDIITDTLKELLPEDYPTACDILVNSLGPELGTDQESLDGVDLSSIHGFVVVALTNYVAQYGKEHFDISMNAFYEMTKRFSSEGAIRYFIVDFEKKVLQIFKKWVKDPNTHIRRLVSESLRPRLPWTIRLQQYVDDPKAVIPFLDTLKDDTALYVRRSVANNLNDIAKDHPDVVTDLLQKWNTNKSKERQWMIRHALRTLIKQGNKEALEIMGFSSDVNVSVSDVSIVNDSITLGESLEFSFSIESKSNKKEKLAIDYIIYHKKASGKVAPKTFKLTTKTISPKETIEINKKHPIKKISTRKYYTGEHFLSLQINGKEYKQFPFHLTTND